MTKADPNTLRLENSQEIKNCFSTLDPSHNRMAKVKDNYMNKTDDSISVKRSRKGAPKTRKYFHERTQNVASIYKKSSLSIANFLSNYIKQPKNKSTKKRRKSGRSTTMNAYNVVVNKKNVRSQSNISSYPPKANEAHNESADNFGNIHFTQNSSKVKNSVKNVSEIRLKRSSEVRNNRQNKRHLSINRGQAYRDTGGRNTGSNRNDVVSTSANSKRIKNSHSGAIRSKTLHFENNRNEAATVEFIMDNLRKEIEATEAENNSDEDEGDHENENIIWETKEKINDKKMLAISD